jgi:putative ABC transport system permease protein
VTLRLLQATLAHWRQARTLTVLTVLGVALGVASVVCIQIINQGSLAAFAGSMQAVSGEADLVVRGQGPDLDESRYPEVLAHPDVAAAWPLVRAWARLSGRDAYLDVVGVDVFAPVRYPVALADRAGPLGGVAAMLTEPGWIALTPSLAEEIDLAVGDTLTVAAADRLVGLRVGALVDFQRLAPLASRKLALMDIAQAQHAFGRSGRITQIDVQVAAGVDVMEARDRLQERLGPGVRVMTPVQREQNASGLLAAFRLNLTALSLISVLVGAFLVFSAVHASLVRRRRHFGLLRSLGADRRQVLAVILIEAALLGLAGTLVGLPLGHGAAMLNIDTVSATLTSIYLLGEIERVQMPPLLLLLGVVVGVGGALLGALLPALDIARRDPVVLLSAAGLPERIGRLAPRLALAGAGLLAAVVVWYVAAGHALRVAGFVLAFFLMASLPLFTPLVLREACGRVPAHGFGWRLGLRGLGSRLQSTAFAVAALAVTVSMLVGITLLIGSFRATLDTWIERSLVADIYVTGATWERDHGLACLSDDVLATLGGHPDVRFMDLQRRLAAHTVDGGPVRLLAIARRGDAAAHWSATAPLLAGDRDRLAARLEAGAAMISEPLARRQGLAVGDSLRLAGARGPLALPVAAVVYDYASESGVAFMTWPTLAGVHGPGCAAAAALTLVGGAETGTAIDQLRTDLGDRAVELRSNRRLRAEVLDIFDQTFAITSILQAMALLIAICGVSLTLLIMGRERATELALHRALGATRAQVFRLGLSEGAGLGLLGLLLGLAGGAALAAILILIINRDWFGWTIRFDLPLAALLGQAAWILGGALLAAVYPALRASRTPATELTREDLL